MDSYEERAAFSELVSEFRHGVEDGMKFGGLAAPLTPTWRFKIGQCISHEEQILPSLVMARVRTTKGHEVYGVRSFMDVDPNRDRMIGAESLVDVVPGSLPCFSCILHQTGMCPGIKR